MFDNIRNRYAMFVCLNIFGKSSRCLQVAYLGADTYYQGMGLPIILYEFLVTKLNLVLISGSPQTPGGKSVWEKLATRPNIFMFGYDGSRKKSFQIDQHDLFNEDIYDDILADEIEELRLESDKLSKELYKLRNTLKNKEAILDLKARIAQVDHEYYELRDSAHRAVYETYLVAIRKPKK